MLIDCGDASTLSAWCALRPAAHAAQLEALTRLPLWEPFREQLLQAIATCTCDSTGPPTSSIPTPVPTT
jgi:hypothetical protein